jgi:hypothetical protein
VHGRSPELPDHEGFERKPVSAQIRNTVNRRDGFADRF